MKYIKQLSIILGISFVGEMLNFLLPLPIPASIYGLVIMFIGLNFNIIKYSSIKETSAFLLLIMPLMFIPASVGVMVVWGEMQKILVPLFVIVVASTFIVMGVTGKTTDLILYLKERKK
ncbi:MAG: CidA/LrgA family protein [Anaerovoracaceae bacterium]